jgi:signal transduction histidine kinase
MLGRMELLAILVAALAAAGVVGMAQRRALLIARRERDHAQAAAAAATRVAHLAAGDLRDCALHVLGRVEQLSGGQPDAQDRVAGAVAAVRRLMALADDLQDQGVPDLSRRALRVETLPLEPAVRDAIAAVGGMLGPAHRHWRVAPDLAGQAVLADRRALAQVLQRVLGNAARNSAPEDWIEVGLGATGDRLELTIADEGNGLCAPDRSAQPGQPDSRGLGLGLSLARTLMAAHGGTLVIESAQRVGTRVVLAFPSDRTLQPAVSDHAE